MIDPDTLSLEAIDAMHRTVAEESAENLELFEAGMRVPYDYIDILAQNAAGNLLLDVGCGPARYAEVFTQRGFEYCGVDISPKFVNIARQRHPGLQFDLMSYRDLRYHHGVFDCLWSCCVLNHEPKRNIIPVLSEHKRVLAEKGLFAIVLPYIGSANESVHASYPSGRLSYFAHWGVDEFCDKLREAGFRVVEAFPDEVNGAMFCLACR